ncbi:MAG TPA: sialidase family protein [Acidimicrobiales bacterium]|nr:sialidase family protein [Acidimicrobiales bacterium]
MAETLAEGAEGKKADLEKLAADVKGAIARRNFPWFDPTAGETVLVPSGQGRGYWVGAPSVVEDQDGRVLLSYRRRRPRDGSNGERGYLAAIAESTDGGMSFSDIWSITKHQVGTSSLERFCLRPDTSTETTGARPSAAARAASAPRWRLYTSWEDPPSSGRWRVDLIKAAAPDAFELAAATPVLLAAEVGVDAVKDPYVVQNVPWAEPDLMYLSTFLTPTGPAPTSLASSPDGTKFAWEGTALATGTGWDAYQARISSVAPFGSGFVAYYDGATTPADDTEEHCGVAVSVDLRHWRSATQRGPVLVSPHATGSLRYVEVARLGGQWWAYYEYARPDGAHELRRNRLPDLGP